ncbi:MAG: response regulator transcription factor [Anaerolineae bacterium]
MVMEPSHSRIRVLIVDDHEMVRQGLALALESFDDLEMVGEAKNGVEAVEFCTRLCPDVVLMDLQMPEMDGVVATRKILDLCPDTHIVALTSFKDNRLVLSALKAGASGYILKDTSVDDLAEAVRKAHAGGIPLSPEVTEALIEMASRQKPSGILEYSLTEREIQVLACLVDGMTNRQIAVHMGLSPSTIKSYVSSILAKLGVDSRTEAVSVAIRENLIT